jgi:hypothetical protein
MPNRELDAEREAVLLVDFEVNKRCFHICFYTSVVRL